MTNINILNIFDSSQSVLLCNQYFQSKKKDIMTIVIGRVTEL